MKKILIIFTFLAILVACENQENSFDDFDYTTGYFPYQYPVRTLVLGDYIYDNTNDNNHKFLISAAMGGLYKNKKDRVFEIAKADGLCQKVLFAKTKDTIRLMPSNYYTLSSSNKLVIPAGKVNGSIEVQLTDAFFNDPLAIKLGYVIPLKLVQSFDLDTILQGKPAVANADPRIAAHWSIAPKDFTMFAVKYVNPYHGNYLHRGVSTVKDASNAVIEKTVYREKFLVDNPIWSLTTTSLNQVSTSNSIKSAIVSGTFGMLLTFSNNGSCTVKEAPGSAFAITGSGKLVDDAETWGGEKRDAIHLTYQFTSGTNTYSASDTLVIRDRGVVMEVYAPQVY